MPVMLRTFAHAAVMLTKVFAGVAAVAGVRGSAKGGSGRAAKNPRIARRAHGNRGNGGVGDRPFRRLEGKCDRQRLAGGPAHSESSRARLWVAAASAAERHQHGHVLFGNHFQVGMVCVARRVRSGEYSGE